MAEQRLIGDWILEREIGSGSFAKVWRAAHTSTQQVAAVKEINMEKLNKKLLDSLRSEVAVLKHTKHQNIVCLLDLIQDTTSNRLFIVLEFCAGGDLGHYIKRYRQVSEATARYFLQQLAEGLKELRRHNVIHRDLKPQNLLLSDSTSTPLLKIADFGFARSLAPQGLAETLCGSPLYMAPEILQFHKYDAKADLWSVGTILYELLVGKPPFNGANHMQLLRNIERNEARLPEAVAGRLSPACKGLLAGLLQRNPVKRMSFEEFFQHPFLTGSAGAAAGVPPSLPIAPATVSLPTSQAVLPAAVRQAAAAVTAVTGSVPAHKASHAGLPRPSLHLQGPPVDAPQSAGRNSRAVQQQQHQQFQELGPWAQQPQQQQCMSPSVHQQQPVTLVSRPVITHPLAARAAPQRDEAELMSDSMEDDFVVVHNPTDCAAQAKSGSNSSSSKASSGLVDPKAAAVLAGAPVNRATWTGGLEQQQQQQQQQYQQQGSGLRPFGLAGAAGAAWPTPGSLVHQQQQQQQNHVHYVPVGSAALGGAGVASTAAWMPGLDHVAQPARLAAENSVQQSMATQPPTLPQRMQLLAQVVHGCTCLLARCHEAGATATAGDAAAAATQQGQQLAVLLLALQIVQSLCLPHSREQQQQQEEEQEGAQCAQGSCGEDASVSALLGAASQADLEQLMSGAVELLQLTKRIPCVAYSICEQDDGGLHFGATKVCPAGDGGVSGVAGGLGHMAESLLALPLPDPFEVLQEYALDSCRAAAVEEVMGNWHSSMAGYSLAADLLLFLSCQWPQLGSADPALLPEERAALHELYVAVNARLAAVVAEAPSAVLC